MSLSKSSLTKSGREMATSLLGSKGLGRLAHRVRRNTVVTRVLDLVDDLRADFSASGTRVAPRDRLAQRIVRRLIANTGTGVQTIVNATDTLRLRGVQLPLADSAADAIALAAREFVTLNAEQDNAHSAPRLHSAEQSLIDLTGCKAALVLASPASALLAVFTALAGNQEVALARGDVGCLDGAVRLSELAAAANVRLREIGTTNHVRLDDYRQALADFSGFVLRHRPADYAIAGAHSDVTTREVVRAAHQAGRIVVQSLERACLTDLSAHGLNDPTVGHYLADDVDLVVFGGDWLIGGPRCGIVVGRRELVDRVARHPLAACLTVDTLTLVALDATLGQYRESLDAVRTIPVQQLLGASGENLRHRAERLAEQLTHAQCVARAEAAARSAFLTEARLPHETLSSWAVAIEPAHRSCEQLAALLRNHDPAIWTGVDGGRLWINLRGVLPRQDEQIVASFLRLDTPTATPSFESSDLPATP